MSHYIKKKVISIAAPVLNKSQLFRLFSPFCAGIGQILTFHRVLPDRNGPRIHNHNSLEISPEQLERTIQFYQQLDYAFISLDHLHQQLTNGTPARPFVVFTFDDGYRDNLTYAYPILKKYGIPFTIYVATHFPDQEAILWWYLLEDALLENENLQFEWEGQQYAFSCTSRYEKEMAFDQIRQLINSRFSTTQHLPLLQQIFKKSEAELYLYTRSETLSWEDIQQLSLDPLVSIGAHSVHHYPLIQLDEQALYEEIEQSKTKIEQQIGKPVKHFAYPFGKAVEASYREFEAVKAIGFQTATTTRMGNIFPQHAQFMECLPRISVNSASNEPVLRLQTSGMLPFLYHKGKRIITH